MNKNQQNTNQGLQQKIKKRKAEIKLLQIILRKIHELQEKRTKVKEQKKIASYEQELQNL